MCDVCEVTYITLDREKWTLFDESTRVPLLISHPRSPFQGQRYTHPVELIDIFPTVLDLLHILPSKPCPNIGGQGKCQPLAGQSLAPVVMGTHVTNDNAPSAVYTKRLQALQKSKNSRQLNGEDEHLHAHVKQPAGMAHSRDKHHKLGAGDAMPVLARKFAISQDWRCAKKELLQKLHDGGGNANSMRNPWYECNRADKVYDDQLSVMGYSFRSSDYRYTIWLHFDRVKNIPQFGAPPYAEELYDHRNEVLSNFTYLEYHNLINRPQFATVAANMKQWALHYLQTNVLYMGPYPN